MKSSDIPVPASFVPSFLKMEQMKGWGLEYQELFMKSGVPIEVGGESGARCSGFISAGCQNLGAVCSGSSRSEAH